MCSEHTVVVTPLNPSQKHCAWPSDYCWTLLASRTIGKLVRVVRYMVPHASSTKGQGVTVNLAGLQSVQKPLIFVARVKWL